MNPATEALLMQLRDKKSAVKETGLTPREEAEKKIYRGSDGTIGVASVNLYAAMIAAGRSVKYGGKQLSTASSSSLPGFMAIEEEHLPFTHDEWVPDIRRGVNPKGGDMVCLIRPKFPVWGFQVHILVDDGQAITGDAIASVLRVAGGFIGLGDFRPSKRGPFGRFRVVSWGQVDA